MNIIVHSLELGMINIYSNASLGWDSSFREHPNMGKSGVHRLRPVAICTFYLDYDRWIFSSHLIP